ncbi:MAG: bifunctional phosphopantothenoylcysteine decarboxylase/phosphopantothenate--cysteine ligase CoaBC [Oceanococcaceae bacterium]
MPRNILLGISGGIAAYKACDLTRRLRERGHAVQVVMTAGAQEFVTPLTLQALSGREVRTTLFDTGAEAAMGHIELARWADVVVVAPASADLLARAAQGMANDLLTTVLLATAAPVLLAPAMNQQMWAHPAVQANLALLQKRGVRIIGPASGEQACGDVGAGRMVEPLAIVEVVEAALDADGASEADGPLTTPAGDSLRALAGVNVLLTAGPTREALDPVRFLSNRSSGRMGFALAQALADAGAAVTLVHGPCTVPVPVGVDAVAVESALDMHAAVMARAADAAIFVATAAVADYRAEAIADAKIKKSADAMQVQLVKNPDILADVTAHHADIFAVGFAAETHEVAHYARDKMQRKNLAMICANEVGDGKGFEVLDNALHVFWPGGDRRLGPSPKPALAAELVALIAARFIAAGAPRAARTSAPAAG